jgi:acetylornithine aminotransferase
LDHAAHLGTTWAAELAAVPGVSHVRGAGLLLGVVLNQPVAGQVRALAQEAGFLVNAPAPDVIRLAPPLVLTQAQAATFTAALPALIQEA